MFWATELCWRHQLNIWISRATPSCVSHRWPIDCPSRSKQLRNLLVLQVSFPTKFKHYGRILRVELFLCFASILSKIGYICAYTGAIFLKPTVICENMNIGENVLRNAGNFSPILLYGDNRTFGYITAPEKKLHLDKCWYILVNNTLLYTLTVKQL